MATILFSELIKNRNYEKIRHDILLGNFVEFKEKDFGVLKRLDVDNENSSKLEQGVKSCHGKDIIYYLKDYKTTIHISNSFGFSGRGQNYTTTNLINILKIEDDIFKTDIQDLMSSIDYNANLREIDKVIKRFVGIELKENKNKKFKFIEDFIQENPKLISKYILEELGGKLLMIDIQSFKDFISYREDIQINATIKWNGNIIDFLTTNRNVSMKNLFKKINSKLVHKEHSFKNVDFIQYLKDLNIPFQLIKKDLIQKEQPFALIIGTNDFKGFNILNQIQLDKKETYNIYLKENEIFVSFEEKRNLLNELSSFSDLELTMEQIRKIKDFIKEI